MKKLLFALFMIGFLFSCSGEGQLLSDQPQEKSGDLAVAVPDCIEVKIRKIKAKTVQNPSAEVWKWQADGQTYFYITSGCCDQYNYLYDNKCNEVCAPDGGITGNGDGKCPEFDGEIEKTLVWKDNR